MYNQFGATRTGRADAPGSDSEAEGRQDFGGRRNNMYNRGSVEADSDFGTPQPYLGPASAVPQWAGSMPPSTAQAVQWQSTPATISQHSQEVDPIPVVDRPIQPPKPKRTRVKGGRKNANTNVAGDSTGQGSGSTQPIIQPSLAPVTQQTHPRQRPKPDDLPVRIQYLYPDLAMPAASSSSSQKKYPPSLSRTQSGAKEPQRQGPSHNSRQPIAVDYSLLNTEDEGPADFYNAPPTPSQSSTATSSTRERPSALPLEKNSSGSRHRDSMSASQNRATPQPSHHTGAQEMPPPSSPVRPKVKRRLLTLLIEDKRVDGMELAEIRVPLQQRGENLWVDAAHVVEGLQSGPARIDGPCKVHAMRGHFRQRFLRIEHDGREVYDEQQSLQVVEDARGKILNVFVEPIPVPLASTPAYPSTPHDPSTLLNTNQALQLPLTPHSTGPSPLPAHQASQHKRKRMASARDPSCAPEGAAPEYAIDYGDYGEPSQKFQQAQEVYQSDIPSSSRKRLRSNVEIAPSSHSDTPSSTFSRPSQPERVHSDMRVSKAAQPASGRSSSQQTPLVENVYGADDSKTPSPQEYLAQHQAAPSTPAYRQRPFDLDAPPTISTGARAVKSSVNSLGIGLPSARMSATRGGPTPAASVGVPEVVDISSRDSSPDRSPNTAPSPLFSQASPPPAVDGHAHDPSAFSPTPFDMPQPQEASNQAPSPASPPIDPEPPAPSSSPPLDPAIAKMLPLDVPPTTYVASEMPSFADQIEQGIAARITNTLRMDGFGFKDFMEKLTAGQALSNERALHWYRWVHEKVQKYANGTATAPHEYERRLIEPKHVLAALQVTEAWYEIVKDTLRMMMAYGPGGQRGAVPRIVQAASDQKPGDARLGVVRHTSLLLLLREVHNEWSQSQISPRE